MKNHKSTTVSTFFIIMVLLLQAHSDGRATRDRDNTGAPGGQSGGNGMMITCSNCHSNGGFDLALNLELFDADNNPISEYTPNETYVARVTIESVTGDSPSGYGFQMVSLIDSDDSDVDGWSGAGLSSNVQLTFANSTGRVYAEHNNLSESNEFTAEWVAPEVNSGAVSFYVAGIGANSNGASTGDYAPTPVRVTFSEATSTSTTSVNPQVEIDIYPNPVHHHLNVRGNTKNKIVDIYSQGSLIESYKLDSDHALLDLTSLASGIYFIVIRSPEAAYLTSKRVIKI